MPLTPNTDPPMIQLSGVTKTYEEAGRRRPVFEGLNMRIARGETAVVLGRSGSGKSTLLNLISGIDLPDTGEVMVDGVNLTRLGERERTLFRRRCVGFVFQFFNLIPTLTVEENLLLPLELNNTLTDAERRRALALLQEVGLGERRNTYPDRLSGGEQQRIAIARALVHRPALLLADEPTGNLDAETGALALELLSRLIREADMTMVVVTHSAEVIAIADRVLTVRDGRLWETR